MLYPENAFTGKNGIAYTLRSPAPEDAAQMLSYLKATAEETEFGLSYPEELDFTLEDEVNFINQYAADSGSLMISAFQEGKLVGNASLSCVMERRKVLHRATFGMAILKSHWGNGLGREILSALIDFAGQAGYEYLELEVTSSNIAAVSLYNKLGFTVYGERPHSLKLKDGSYYDELLMVLDLR